MPVQSKKEYRSIFISDFHIGAKTFNAPALLDFLRSTESEYLYLVGDIIDGWKLKKRWLWSETVNQIFDELARKVDHGTKLFYVPGNHDDTVRTLPIFSRLRFSKVTNIKIADKVVHKTQNGRKFLVMHGDQFDTKILSEPVLKTHHEISGFFADIATRFSPPKPYIEIDGTLKRFSLAKYLSKHGRLAIQTLNNFEGLVYNTVKKRGLDGIICGHTHIPVLKKIKDITYANTGSWLRNENTALVEDETGELSLLDWDAQNICDDSWAFQNIAAWSGYANIHLTPDAHAYRPITNFVVRKIHKIWGPDSKATHAMPAPVPQLSYIRTKLPSFKSARTIVNAAETLAPASKLCIPTA